MRIIEETQLDFSDLLISPKRSTLNSRSEVSLLRTFNWTGLDGKTTNTLECIPIMASNMATTGTPKMARILTKRGFMCCLEKHIPIQEICDLYLELERDGVQSEKSNPLEYTQRLVPSIGIKESLDGFKQLAKEHKVTCVCVDVPNGYIPNFMTRVKDVVKLFPNALVFAGNVVTGDICQDLVFNHALIPKCGIGPGSCCMTRAKTGVGRPQASTLIECADECHQVGGFCLCDGGCTTPGDIVKAFGCGADFVMLGGMFAGVEEAAGETVEIDGKKFKQFYGMSSNLAQEKHFGGIRSYSTTEGREVLIPVTGTLDEALDDIEGGIKSAMCYIGARQLKNIPKNCTFYKVHNQLNTRFADCKHIR